MLGNPPPTSTVKTRPLPAPAGRPGSRANAQENGEHHPKLERCHFSRFVRLSHLPLGLGNPLRPTTLKTSPSLAFALSLPRRRALRLPQMPTIRPRNPTTTTVEAGSILEDGHLALDVRRPSLVLPPMASTLTGQMTECALLRPVVLPRALQLARMPQPCLITPM